MSTARARLDGFIGWSGGEVRMHYGDEYPADHPLVLERPELFSVPPKPAPTPAPEPEPEPAPKKVPTPRKASAKSDE